MSPYQRRDLLSLIAAADASSSNQVERVRIPLLFINAADDPFAPAAGIAIEKYTALVHALRSSFLEHTTLIVSPQLTGRQPLTLCRLRASDWAGLALTQHGGHVAFCRGWWPNGKVRVSCHSLLLIF